MAQNPVSRYRRHHLYVDNAVRGWATDGVILPLADNPGTATPDTVLGAASIPTATGVMSTTPPMPSARRR